MGTSETTSNTPADETGEGPVTIGDRAEPLAVPELSDMNVGSADPQAPRHPNALGSGGTGSYSDEAAGRAPGPEQPLQQPTGTSHRAPGLHGSTPQGESVDSDVRAGAARMGAQAVDSTAGTSPGQGDDQGVPSSGTQTSPGTSEEHRVVAGIRLPDADQA